METNNVKINGDRTNSYTTDGLSSGGSSMSELSSRSGFTASSGAQDSNFSSQDRDSQYSRIRKE